MYIPAEGRFTFLLKNNFRYLHVAILPVEIFSFCICSAFLTFLCCIYTAVLGNIQQTFRRACSLCDKTD
jgi:hypothetical protein